MNDTVKKDLFQFMNSAEPLADGVIIYPSELIFEENVKMNCYYCGKYGNNWRCPPNLPNIDYPKMMTEYDYGLFVILKYQVTKETYAQIRNDSSIILHKLLLNLEKWMWNHNRSNAISFTAGSCKLCRGGCGKEKCNNPYLSRSPLEATGVNIIKSAKKYGIDVNFPTDKELMRIGLLLWQENN